MAWRIEDSVIRGEIDNRIRGWVTGFVMCTGHPKPVEFKLRGNCWRDLAGRKLEFVNPTPSLGNLVGLPYMHNGIVGDITASRKVKVPDIPMEQIGEYYTTQRPFPWHWGNSLYLEWFNENHARVVVESACFQLKIVGDSTWDMTAAEEEIQRKANDRAIELFIARLDQAAKDAQPDEGDYSEDDERKFE